MMKVYLKSKRVALVAPRDTYLNCLYDVCEDGSVKMVSYSVDDETLSPEKNIKMFIKAAGFHIIPYPEDP
jgi:hypothetical protein